MEEIIIEKTTQEIINEKESRKLEILSELSSGDYKHSRQIRERQIGCSLTMSETDYNAFCEHQRKLTEEYNLLEVEVSDLQSKLSELKDAIRDTEVIGTDRSEERLSNSPL